MVFSYFNVKQVLMKQVSEIFPSRKSAIKSELSGNFQIAGQRASSCGNLLATIRRKFTSSRERREIPYMHTRMHGSAMRAQTK